ncbi:uncharacterized protein LOC130665374 isoform X2 [Microplitis mediator]|uniref:uncharacterized protein LOC130665374 isoform X2 n=1 Tax=Microplitis mediator TaxID=375433 RepID=UPI0025565F7B|nr:uncharacterized protein LOC130665374 isoform X2 [Microplitis mediator]
MQRRPVPSAQLFELCFANTSNPIAITENLVETFHKNLSITIKAPVVIINENFISKDIQLYYPTYPMYILSVSSDRDLWKIVEKLHFSPLWSQKSMFFVIFNTENSCERSVDILSVLWDAELLSIIVVCSRTGNETSLYTYNPFTNRAPNPWIKINMNLIDWRNRPLTLYNQSLTNDHKICESLFFDKTQVLDGYPVNIAARDKISTFYYDSLFNSINMTPQATYFGSDVLSLYLSLVNESNDVSTIYNPYYNDPSIFRTVPWMEDVLWIIVTQKANFQSASYEIANVIDINGAIAIIFLLLLITLLIVLHNKYQIGLAVLDVLKLLMSMGIDAPLDRLAMKITFFTGFLFVFFFSPLLEGQLFAVLTHPPTYNMESLKDLYDHKYHVYYPSGIESYILDEQIWKSNEDMKYLHNYSESYSLDDCLKLVRENNTVAIIDAESFILKSVVQHNLHISKRFKMNLSSFKHTRLFWALADRFYHKALHLQSSGIGVVLADKFTMKSRDKLRAKEKLKRIIDYQIIDAVDLTYLYVFMAFFQFLAIIVFGIEYIVGRYRRPRQ